MKRIIGLTILLFLVCCIGFAQDSTTTLTWQPFYASTLTGAKDTLDVTWGSDTDQFNYFMVSVQSSAVDTIQVYTLAPDNVTWTLSGVTGITTGTTAAFIAASTTNTKYFIVDPLPQKIRLISLSDDGSTCAFVVSAVYSKQ